MRNHGRSCRQECCWRRALALPRLSALRGAGGAGWMGRAGSASGASAAEGGSFANGQDEGGQGCVEELAVSGVLASGGRWQAHV